MPSSTTLSETVFCCQPTGFTDPAHPDLVCCLRKSLYGLKQAPRAWYSRFATYLTTLGFIEAKSDTSLFIFRRGSDTVYLLLYVDDIILIAFSMELLCRTIFALQREFTMKDLGPLPHFLGIIVERCPDGLFLHQHTYTLDILKCAVMADCKSCTTPVDLQAKLAEDSGPLVEDVSQFWSIAGALQYLTFTRLVRNRTLTLIEREDDTRSWGNFLVYFSLYHNAMPSKGLKIHTYSQPRIC
jgi:hypothetical protein